jgi:hypothetical protein
MTSRHHRSNRLFVPLLGVILLALRTAAIDITKSADDYFHNGALAYLTNNIPVALNVVTNGLQQYPDDEKLKKLEELLKQQQQQQQNQKQDQQKSDQQKQQDQKKDQSQQSKQDDKQKGDEQKQKEEQDKQKQAQQPKPDEKKDSGEQQQAAAAQQGEQMTPEQAMRVLDTTKGDEKVLPVQMAKPPPTDKKLKDW